MKKLGLLVMPLMAVSFLTNCGTPTYTMKFEGSHCKATNKDKYNENESVSFKIIADENYALTDDIQVDGTNTYTYTPNSSYSEATFTCTMTANITVTVGAMKAMTIKMLGADDQPVDMPAKIDVGQTIKVAAYHGNTKIDESAFESSNLDVATIDTNEIKGIGEGETTITCKATDYKDATCNLAVAKKTMTIKMLDASDQPVDMPAKINVNDTIKVAAYDVDDVLVSDTSFTASEGGIISISGNAVKGIAEGEATITCTASGYKDATCDLEVTLKDTLVIKMLSGDEPVDMPDKIDVGQTIKVAAYDGATKIDNPAFTSSGKGSVTIDGNEITGATEGAVVITCTASGYKDATCDLEVAITHDIEIPTYDGLTIAPKVGIDGEDYIGTIHYDGGAYPSVMLPLSLDSVMLGDEQSTQTDITDKCIYEVEPNDNESAIITIPGEYFTADVEIDLTMQSVGAAKWYDYANWWDHCSDAKDDQAVLADVGKVVKVKLNGLMHEVRLIDVNHKNFETDPEPEAHCTFEFANVITDSNGAVYTKWDARDGAQTKNYNYMGSTLDTLLNSSDDDNSIYNKLPEGLKNSIKRVKKPIAIYDKRTSEYIVRYGVGYTFNLFPLSFREINGLTVFTSEVAEEGSAYAYYQTPEGEQLPDIMRAKPAVGGDPATENVTYWLRSPLVNEQDQQAWEVVGNDESSVYGPGSIINHGRVGSSNYAIAPAFCI